MRISLALPQQDEWNVSVGSSLGEITDELEEYRTDSYNVVVFTCGGLRNYSCIVFSPM